MVTQIDKVVSKAASTIAIISLPEERSFRKAFKPINKFKLCIVLLTNFNFKVEWDDTTLYIAENIMKNEGICRRKAK